MSNESRGTVADEPRIEMWAFDQLPPKLRARINNARGNWSAVQILGMLRDGKPHNEVARMLNSADKKISGGPNTPLICEAGDGT